ncbi:hypothetical protein [Wolbachia pipientis]|nr:hypothetical protein [Wolbachia pipientis]
MICSDYCKKSYNFSGNLKKIELELINEKYMQVQVIAFLIIVRMR